MAEPDENRLYQMIARVTRIGIVAERTESDGILPCFVFGPDERTAARRCVAALAERGLTWLEFAPHATVIAVERWQAHVDEEWGQVARYLPTQGEVARMSRTDGIFFGPLVGFESIEPEGEGGA